jgi:ubiquinone/menaquinone biosynthesis C-methylase UbiE
MKQENNSNPMSLNPRYSDLEYTVRRYYVDEFCFRHIPKLSGSILDLGGKKINKRGQFDISQYLHLAVSYVNMDRSTNPDICSDASSIPISDYSFDAVLCIELLEHVPDPKLVLAEAYRVLKHSGCFIACVPFLYPIHADPFDYGRYTDYYWAEILKELGFTNIQIERQGMFWSVLMDYLKQYANKTRVNRALRWFLGQAIAVGQRYAFRAEMRTRDNKKIFLSRFTTGFGIVCRK